VLDAQERMNTRTQSLVAASLLVACATGGDPGEPDPEPVDFVQVVIYNHSTIPGWRRVFAQWDGFTRVELGELDRGASMTRTLPVDGASLRIEFYQAGSATVSVIPGERIEFILDGRGVHSRRLPSRVRQPAGN
jgi:hypothetical protein